MKSTSDALKSIKVPAYPDNYRGFIGQVKYMIDNQYHSIRCILEEQNEVFCNKRSATEQNDISEFFDSQLDENSHVMRFLCEVRESLTAAVDTPLELPFVLNSLREASCKGSNEWILDMFSEVIQYMYKLRYSSAIEHPSGIESRKAA